MDPTRGVAVFQPKARIIKLLGDELITNEVIAVFELIKNSYDADATEVIVELDETTKLQDGKIVIQDDGSGMTLETVLNSWLQPGTDNKKLIREKGERSKKFNRYILGEKGVGRFAAQKLGTQVTLITKTASEDLETLVEVNWEDFDNDKMLSDIPIKWIRTSPKVFKQNRSGTRIEITKIRNAWTEDMAINLSEKIISLQSPFDLENALEVKSHFKISLKCTDYPDVVKRSELPKNLFQNSIYTLSGSVTEDGSFSGEYTFLNPAFKDLKRVDFRINIENIREPEDFKISSKEWRKPACGPFKVKFYVWDLDIATLRETITRKVYNTYVKPHTGVRIFRDMFRIWPYGEKGDDWLNLDIRRVNNPDERLSNNQIIGFVEINQQINPSLKDKTDREGLIDGQEFRDFRSLVTSCLSELEYLRRQDKSKVDKLRTRAYGKKIDETVSEIDDLRIKVSKNSHDDLYSKSINSIENAHNRYKENTVEKLLVMAGMGIVGFMPAHEVHIQVKDLRPILDDMEKMIAAFGFSGRLTDKFSTINRIIDTLDDVSDGALELTKREKREFTLRSIVEYALRIKEPEIAREAIMLEIIDNDKLKIKGYSNLVLVAITNIIDNAIWWLQYNKSNRKIRITIKKDLSNNPMVIISDNGPGISVSDVEFLGEAFYTHKTKGTGLGLFISKRALEANNGKLDFGFYGHDPAFLEGANVFMTFERGGSA